MPCNPDKIMSALKEQAELITDITHEDIASSDKYVLGKIPDGGVVERHSNQDAIIYGKSRQAAVAYREKDHSVKPLIDGQMKARTTSGFNGILDTDVNDYPDNACHGNTTIDFAQGFRERSAVDFEIDLDTPVKCVRELERLEKRHVRGYLEGFETSFRRFGYDNFNDNLMNEVIKRGEANASVIAADQFRMTTNGWQSPPGYRISIHFLEDYRRNIMRTMRGLGMKVSDDFKLEVEMPMEDWIEAVKQDQIANFGAVTGNAFNQEWFKNPEKGIMAGRQYGEWRGIRAYFNESPIRGYFKPKGDGTYSFVRVYPEINVIGEEGGVVLAPNYDYDLDTIVVEGVKYEMITLIPHIHPMSFKRWGLAKPLKTAGGENSGVNWDVKVIDGAYIDCNEANDKFKLFGRHEFRLLAKYPELSGYIAYRHGLRPGYVIEVSARDYQAGSSVDTTPEEFRQQEIDNCTSNECAQCDQVVDGQTLQCVDPEDATASILALSPSGAVSVVTSTDDPATAVFYVTRTGGLGVTASVNYATADGTATAGSDYTAASGTLTWEPGDTAPKAISVPFLAAATDAQTVTLTLSGAVNATIATDQDDVTITIDKI